MRYPSIRKGTHGKHVANIIYEYDYKYVYILIDRKIKQYTIYNIQYDYKSPVLLYYFRFPSQLRVDGQLANDR